MNIKKYKEQESLLRQVINKPDFMETKDFKKVLTLFEKLELVIWDIEHGRR